MTWGNGTTGVTGLISSSNSLIGSHANDNIGSGTIFNAFSNGNYVIFSPKWDNVTVTDAGAVTWGNGSTGITGIINIGNSLIGTKAGDNVGNGNNLLITSNDNYVISSPNWDNGTIINAGAVTLGSGSIGISGTINSSNSLIGTKAFDNIGTKTTSLGNGNYLVSSPDWDNGLTNDVGAVTFGNGAIGVTGNINISNSLIGTSTSDKIGNGSITILNNGNYVVSSPNWKNGTFQNAGAATWGNGTIGITGIISISNSLVGTKTNDSVGGYTVALTNGNYAVGSAGWDNGILVNAGAVTWGNGTTGISGAVSVGNSLIGSTSNDQVGNTNSIVALSNGHYITCNPNWDNGSIANVGSVTWGNGYSGSAGVISASNSLIGIKTGDQIGSSKVTALTNGHYVVSSPNWDNATLANVGAVTWCNGNNSTSDTVKLSNSLVGTTLNDKVGIIKSVALDNGNYIAVSSNWNRGAKSYVGAVTLCNGNSSTVGEVDTNNSIVGSVNNDLIGSGTISPLKNGNYYINNLNCDFGAIADVETFSVSNQAEPIVGSLNNCNSVISTSNVTDLLLTDDTIYKFVIISKEWESKIVIRYYNKSNYFSSFHKLYARIKQLIGEVLVEILLVSIKLNLLLSMAAILL
ncbi:MAG: hypothetical protein IPK03_06705 [Bacteroidetes bacterium]|nr:hypothetical protein [Bacteroidota bacterium]